MSQKFALIYFTFSLLWMLISTTPVTPSKKIVQDIITTQETTSTQETTATSQSIKPIIPAEETTTTLPTTPTPITTATSESMRNLISLTNKTECGKSSNEFLFFPVSSTRIKRIYGGHDAAFGIWAWQVSIRETSFGLNFHICGGSILNEYWVLTAAYCVNKMMNDELKIRVGDYDFSNKSTKYPFVEHNVAKIVMHPKYDSSSHQNDAALIQVTEPIRYEPHIIPICLPGFNDSLVGENATVTGWGKTETTLISTDILQETSLPILSNTECENLIRKAGYKNNITADSFLCAGLADGGPDSCRGDSGGPLQVKSKDGRYFIAGIVSFGVSRKCGAANEPGFYTRVTTIVPWILETIA